VPLADVEAVQKFDLRSFEATWRSLLEAAMICQANADEAGLAGLGRRMTQLYRLMASSGEGGPVGARWRGRWPAARQDALAPHCLQLSPRPQYPALGIGIESPTLNPP
jgi:hypothetical protein